MKGIESVYFQIISYTGAAKSCFVEAINEAEQGNFERAEELLCEGDQNFNEGHHAHFGLLQKEAQQEHVEIRLLLLHAEDQMMAAETIRILAEKFIQIHKELKKGGKND